MQPIDQYILARTAELTRKIRAAYEAFEFHRVYHLLNEFCNSELSAFYLDVLKDRLYTYPIAYKAGREYQRELYLARRSAQTAIYKITDALARLTAPDPELYGGRGLAISAGSGGQCSSDAFSDAGRHCAAAIRWFFVPGLGDSFRGTNRGSQRAGRGAATKANRQEPGGGSAFELRPDGDLGEIWKLTGRVI